MRLPDSTEHHRPEARAGDYWRWPDGMWMCRTPAGFGGNLINHDVTEHEDGTITVSPSILVTTGDGRRWHGYLRRGVWEALDDCVLEKPE
jgi:hypothetical protein